MIVSIDKQLGNPVSSYLLHKSSSLIHILYDSWIFAKIPVGLLKLKGPFAFYFCLFCVPCWCYCYFQYFCFRVMLMIFNLTLCSPSSSHHNPFHRPSKFRQAGSSGGFLTFLFSEKTGLALKQSQVGSYHPLDVYSFQHLMFESYPIQDCQHFWTDRASGLKEETGFLEAPAEARGSRALRGDLSVSANPLLEQRSRAVQGIFISDYALLQWLHWSRRPFKWLRSRGRLNRLHRAAEPPNWSHPSQHQTSWPVKISETGGCCVGSRRRREVGEAPSLGLWSPPPPTTAVTQFSWWGQTIRCDAYHYSRQPF